MKNTNVICNMLINKMTAFIVYLYYIGHIGSNLLKILTLPNNDYKIIFHRENTTDYI